MNAKNTNKPSQTDWARIDALTDDTIDTTDIPPLDDTFFARAKLHAPQHFSTVTMQVDADVLEWFKSLGPEYERRMNAALRLYAESHKAYNK
jgi:uncharacterized protein (DUF4415 family)